MTKKEMLEGIKNMRDLGIRCDISDNELKRMSKEEVKWIWNSMFHEFSK